MGISMHSIFKFLAVIISFIVLLNCSNKGTNEGEGNSPVEFLITSDTTVEYLDTTLTLTGVINAPNNIKAIVFQGDTIELKEEFLDTFNLSTSIKFEDADSLSFALFGILEEGLSDTLNIIVRRGPEVPIGIARISGRTFTSLDCNFPSGLKKEANILEDSSYLIFEKRDNKDTHILKLDSSNWSIDVRPGEYSVFISSNFTNSRSIPMGNIEATESKVNTLKDFQLCPDLISPYVKGVNDDNQLANNGSFSPSAISPSGNIVIYFSESIENNLTNIESGLIFEKRTRDSLGLYEYSSSNFSVSRDSTGKYLTVVPESDLTSGGTYKITVNKSISDYFGNALKEQVFAFIPVSKDVSNSFQFVSSNINSGDTLDTKPRISLLFNSPISPTSIDSHITLSGDVTLNLEVVGPEVNLAPSGSLENEKSYTLKISKDLKELLTGNPLGNDTNLIFHTRGLSSFEQDNGLVGVGSKIAVNYFQSLFSNPDSSIVYIGPFFQAIFISNIDTTVMSLNELLRSDIIQKIALGDVPNVLTKVTDAKLIDSNTVTVAIRLETEFREITNVYSALATLKNSDSLKIAQVTLELLYDGPKTSEDLDSIVSLPLESNLLPIIPGLNLIKPEQNELSVSSPVQLKWHSSGDSIADSSYLLVIGVVNDTSSGLAIPLSDTLWEFNANDSNILTLDAAHPLGFEKKLDSLKNEQTYWWKVIAFSVSPDSLESTGFENAKANSEYGNWGGKAYFSLGDSIEDPETITLGIGPASSDNVIQIGITESPIAEIRPIIRDFFPDGIPEKLTLSKLLNFSCEVPFLSDVGDKFIPGLMDVEILNPIMVLDTIKGEPVLHITGKSEDTHDIEFISYKDLPCKWIYGIHFNNTFSMKDIHSGLEFADGVLNPKRSVVINSGLNNTEVFKTLYFNRFKVRLTSGLHFLGEFDVLKSPFRLILNTKSVPVHAVIAGEINLEGLLNFDVSLADNIKFKQVLLRLTQSITGVGTSLVGQVEIIVNHKDTLIIDAVSHAQIDGFSMGGNMVGEWNDAFGAKGLTIDSLALEWGASFTTGEPVVGLAGTIRVGETGGGVAIKYDGLDVLNSILAGHLDNIKIGDIIKYLIVPTVNVSSSVSDLIPDMGIFSVELYVAAFETKIAEISYPRGFTMKGEMDFYGLGSNEPNNKPMGLMKRSVKSEDTSSFIFVDGTIDYNHGLSFVGGLGKISLADSMIEITGVTEDIGPQLEIILRDDQQKIEIGGYLSVMDISAGAQVNISNEGVRASIKGDLFNLFSTELSLNAGINPLLGGANDWQALDFFAKAKMENDFFEYLRDNVSNEINTIVDDAKTEFEKAEKDLNDAKASLDAIDKNIADRRAELLQGRAEDIETLNKAQADVDNAQADVDDIDQQLADMRKTIEGERASAVADLENAKAKVASIQGEIDDLQATIDSKNKKASELSKKEQCTDQSDCVNIPYPCPTWSNPLKMCSKRVCNPITVCVPDPVAIAEAGVLKTEVAALETAKLALIASKETANLALSAAQTIVDDFLPIDADPRMVALYTAKGILVAAFETANGVLEAAKAAINFAPLELDPELAGYYTAQAVARAGVEAAILVVQGASYTTEGVAAAAEFIANNALGGLIDVRQASFQGGLSAVNGGYVTMLADIQYLGKEVETYSFTFDFMDLGKSVKDFANMLLGL